jgi:hypothetical protein
LSIGIPIETCSTWTNSYTLFHTDSYLDIPLTTATKPHIIPEFFTPLVGVTLLTHVVWLLQLQHQISKIFIRTSFRAHTPTTFSLLDLLGPLRFLIVIPWLPYTTLSWSGSACDDFSINSLDSKGSVLLNIHSFFLKTCYIF